MGSCFCFKPPASIQPRKTYNLLVPDVFPRTSPTDANVLTASTKRSIGKLGEYCQHNPGKIAKVSRRLMRRLRKGLADQEMGFVRIAVQAYIHLLVSSTNEDSKFTFNYLTKELIQPPDAVIQLLLSHAKAEVRTLGAELLANYIKAQNNVEHQADALEPLIATVCGLAHMPTTPTASAMAAVVGECEEALQVSCLHVVREYIRLYQVLRVLPPKLEILQMWILNNMDLSGKGMVQLLKHAESLPIKADELETDVAVDVIASSRHDGSSAVSAQELALSMLLEFRPFLQDIGTVYRVMDTLFRYLDQEGRWQQPSLIRGIMSLVAQSCADQPFPLFSALLRHASAAALPAVDRAVIIRLASNQASVYSLSAFSLALQELPKVLAAAAHIAGGKQDPHQQGLETAIADIAKKLATDVGDAGQLCEALSSVMRVHTVPSGTSLHLLRCCVEATSVIQHFIPSRRLFPGHCFPGQVLSQLAAIMTAWDMPSQTLAQQVLLALIPCCGSTLKSHLQAFTLLEVVYSRATASDLPSDEIQALLQIAAPCTTTSSAPSTLLKAVQLALNLHHKAQHSSAEQCRSQLLLAGQILSQVASAAACPALSSKQVQSVLESNVTVGESTLTVLVEEALCAMSTLRSVFGEQLPQLLQAPFPQSAAQQRVSAGALSAAASMLTATSGTGSACPTGQPLAFSVMPTDTPENAARARLDGVSKARLNLRNVLSIIGGESSEDGEEDEAQDDVRSEEIRLQLQDVATASPPSGGGDDVLGPFLSCTETGIVKVGGVPALSLQQVLELVSVNQPATPVLSLAELSERLEAGRLGRW